MHNKSRDKLFNERPLTGKVQRTSYQDSNIFGYKGNDDITVQNAVKQDKAASRVRESATFQSKVFDNLDGSYPHDDEAFRHASTTRQEGKWLSTVFEGPRTEEVKRKLLGKGDAGQESLFGSDRPEYVSSNVMGGKKPFVKSFVPVRSQKTAEQRKMEEVYGKSVKVYGTGKRHDGSLMADSADWRNPQQQYTNSPVKKGLQTST